MELRWTQSKILTLNLVYSFNTILRGGILLKFVNGFSSHVGVYV